MPSRLSKSRKKRGAVSCGHGRVGKHRKHPGGRGCAGAEHHHRINTKKYHPGYIGKQGMRIFRLHRTQYATKTINVERLYALLDSNARSYYTANNKMPVLDVSRAGFIKVLGSGLPLKHAMEVRAREFSKEAREKIEAAGGKCVLLGAAPEACNAVKAAPVEA